MWNTHLYVWHLVGTSKVLFPFSFSSLNYTTAWGNFSVWIFQSVDWNMFHCFGKCYLVLTINSLGKLSFLFMMVKIVEHISCINFSVTFLCFKIIILHLKFELNTASVLMLPFKKEKYGLELSWRNDYIQNPWQENITKSISDILSSNNYKNIFEVKMRRNFFRRNRQRRQENWTNRKEKNRLYYI